MRVLKKLKYLGEKDIPAKKASQALFVAGVVFAILAVGMLAVSEWWAGTLGLCAVASLFWAAQARTWN